MRVDRRCRASSGHASRQATRPPPAITVVGKSRSGRWFRGKGRLASRTPLLARLPHPARVQSLETEVKASRRSVTLFSHEADGTFTVRKHSREPPIPQGDERPSRSSLSTRFARHATPRKPRGSSGAEIGKHPRSRLAEVTGPDAPIG
jgi:hypothetical protein